uniref:Uncharacterized protein n=1 Tax=Cacopsylla melanoneura TaxID=428564 RepID=A0A8D8ZST6_9HEMI
MFLTRRAFRLSSTRSGGMFLTSRASLLSSTRSMGMFLTRRILLSCVTAFSSCFPLVLFLKLSDFSVIPLLFNSLPIIIQADPLYVPLAKSVRAAGPFVQELSPGSAWRRAMNSD